MSFKIPIHNFHEESTCAVYHLSSRRCKHSHHCNNSYYRRRSTMKIKVFASGRNSHRIVQLAAEDKCRFAISHELTFTSCKHRHPHYITKASLKFLNNCECFNFLTVYSDSVCDLQMLRA